MARDDVCSKSYARGRLVWGRIGQCSRLRVNLRAAERAQWDARATIRVYDFKGGPSRNYPAEARSNSAISILLIIIMAFIARPALPASGSLKSRPRALGTICHERPYLSLSQAH